MPAARAAFRQERRVVEEDVQLASVGNATSAACDGVGRLEHPRFPPLVPGMRQRVTRRVVMRRFEFFSAPIGDSCPTLDARALYGADVIME